MWPESPCLWLITVESTVFLCVHDIIDIFVDLAKANY